MTFRPDVSAKSPAGAPATRATPDSVDTAGNLQGREIVFIGYKKDPCLPFGQGVLWWKNVISERFLKVVFTIGCLAAVAGLVTMTPAPIAIGLALACTAAVELLLFKKCTQIVERAKIRIPPAAFLPNDPSVKDA